MKTFVFQPGLTWRKAGFAFSGNSLAYREVLNANPSWDISAQPAPGSILYKPDSNEESIDSSIGEFEYFPFNSYSEYLDSLKKYSNVVLANPDKYNGWTLTSGEVLTES